MSALVALYLNQEDKEAASEVLVQTVSWYNKNQVGLAKGEIFFCLLNDSGLWSGINQYMYYHYH